MGLSLGPFSGCTGPHLRGVDGQGAVNVINTGARQHYAIHTGHEGVERGPNLSLKPTLHVPQCISYSDLVVKLLVSANFPHPDLLRGMRESRTVIPA